MSRPEFTPKMWHSEDGKYTFRRDKYGFVDICPGPRSRLLEYLGFNYPKIVENPYRSNQGHIH